MSKKNETKVLCPECGAEFAIAEKTVTTVATVIGKDAGIGIVYAEVVGKEPKLQKKLPKTAKERIEALRDAGVDVSHLFAMQGANGGECVASNKDGKLTILDDDDPLFELIIKQGTVPNPRLFRRWVMAQMFHMMTALDYRTKQPMGVTAMIHRMGYEYQWKMLLDELYAQMKMEHRDPENFADRNRWFNNEVATKMASEYIGLLKKRVDTLKVRKCKGIPYKRIAGKNIFVSDLYSKLYHMGLRLSNHLWAASGGMVEHLRYTAAVGDTAVPGGTDPVGISGNIVHVVLQKQNRGILQLLEGKLPVVGEAKTINSVL